MSDFANTPWVDAAGVPLDCREKLKVLAENLTELQSMAQDVFEDAVLMKVAEPQIRRVLAAMIDEMENPYA